MRNLTAVFVLSLASLVGCGFLKKADPDAGAATTDAAVATADTSDAAPATATPTGKNSAAIARFGTEVALNEPKVIGQTSTPRVSPNTGAIVATIHAGTAVTRIATNAGNSLIVFPDPNVPTDSLMGWVSDAAFSAAVFHHDAGTPVASATTTVPAAFACPPGKFAIQKSPTPVCRTPCATDANCASKKFCIAQTGIGGAIVKACLND